MNAQHWIAWFEKNRGSYQEPDWNEPCAIPEHQRQPLAESLAIFQLGETGGGTRLRRFVDQEISQQNEKEEYRQAVSLFIAEEHYHADLLSRLVRHLDGQPRRKHWSNRAFRKVRCLVDLEFNIQVLLTAELIAEAYYGILSTHGPSLIVKDVCSKIVRDEVKHIGFHLDFFRQRQSHWLPLQSQIWALQFQFIFSVTKRVVWQDHGPCFRSLGISRKDFHHRANSACRGFLRRLERIPSTPVPAVAS